MIKINVHLTEAQLKWLEIISKSTGLSRAELIRRGVDSVIESNILKKARFSIVTGKEKQDGDRK